MIDLPVRLHRNPKASARLQSHLNLDLFASASACSKVTVAEGGLHIKSSSNAWLYDAESC